jgi:hypothetical protein
MEMKKIVLNGCYGGFGLSQLALKRLIELGWEEVPSHARTNNSKLEVIINSQGEYYVNDHASEFRTHPDVIKVVEELGEKANSSHAALYIEEIPIENDWEIDEYDGVESLVDLGINFERFAIRLDTGEGVRESVNQIERVHLSKSTLYESKEKADELLKLEGLKGTVVPVTLRFNV